MKVQSKNLLNYRIAQSCPGIGTSNYNHTKGGSFYISHGYGNMENYIDFEILFEILEQDIMVISEFVDIELNSAGEVTYMHLDVWPV